MARTLTQIKQEITDSWMNDSILATAYGYNVGDSWDATFSKVSLENIIVYIISFAIRTHELLFDTHRAEVDNIVSQMKPHSLRWYVNKAKLYRAGQSLIDGSDDYDNTGLTDDQIASMQPVKFAAATESEDATVYIKVAGGGAEKAPISADQFDGLTAYFSEVKDAGVKVSIINEPASKLRIAINVYYNPMVLSPDGVNLQTGVIPVVDAIKNYIENLPFNGEFRTSSLVDAVQSAEGVVIPDLAAVYESYDGINYNVVIVKSTPYAGYYVYEANNVSINYIPYEV